MTQWSVINERIPLGGGSLLYRSNFESVSGSSWCAHLSEHCLAACMHQSENSSAFRRNVRCGVIMEVVLGSLHLIMPVRAH
jgi:hypothetical protein